MFTGRKHKFKAREHKIPNIETTFYKQSFLFKTWDLNQPIEEEQQTRFFFNLVENKNNKKQFLL